jgi:hypothetical protein
VVGGKWYVVGGRWEVRGKWQRLGHDFAFTSHYAFGTSAHTVRHTYSQRTFAIATLCLCLQPPSALSWTSPVRLCGGGVRCDVFVVVSTGHALTASASGHWLVAGEGGQTGGQDQPGKQAGR